MQRPNLLCTEGLIEAGVVDVMYNHGWYEATPAALRAAQHGHDFPAQPKIALPPKAVVSCFLVHFPEAMFQAQIDSPNGKYIFLARDGDPSIREGGGPNCNAAAFPPCVWHVFGINVIERTPRITPMPGCMWAFWDGAMRIPEALAQPKERKNSVLVAHRHDGGGMFKGNHERLTSIAYFRDKPWATVHPALLTGVPGPPLDVCHMWPHPEYLKQVRDHDFLTIPIGYGVERIAPWEAIALGTVPICYRHPEYLQFQDMPIAFVNTWDDVTPAWCDQMLEAMRGRPTEKITLDYWVERIREKRQEL